MDIIKHLSIFNPQEQHKGSVTVIGAGATGTALSLQLAMLGLKEINIYDFDKIEEHNIANQQMYNYNDIGMAKSVTLAKKLNAKVGSKNCKFYNAVTTDSTLYDSTIFVCVDSMKTRKEIFENCIKMNGFTTCLVDIRINATSGQVNIFNSSLLDHCQLYEKTLYSDDEVDLQKGNCGITLSVGATAGLAANFATWLFIDWWSRYNTDTFQLNFEMRPFFTITKSFSKLLADS